jgi:hypothetical protein
MNMKRSSLFVRKIQTDLRKLSKFLSICLLLIALFAPTAQAETVFVNPGTVGDTAQDFTFGAGSNISVDIVWTDNKTLEYTSGTHLFFLYGPPCATYTGVLLDAAGSAIPDSGLAGKSICATGSDLSGGVIELPDVTLFSGIRLVSSGFVGGSAWQWTWEENGKPVVGQTETSSNQPPIADAGAPVTGAVGTAVTFDGSASVDPDSDSIVSYDWDFGDGNYGTGVNPSHSYTGSEQCHPDGHRQRQPCRFGFDHGHHRRGQHAAGSGCRRPILGHSGREPACLRRGVHGCGRQHRPV